MLDSAADDRDLLQVGELYFSGEPADSARHGHRLPVTVFGHGWHPVEHWGVWGSERESRIKLPTALARGAKVLVAIRMHVPPGSDKTRCVVEIGGVESGPKALTRRSEWFVFEGECSRAGIVAITLRALGVFGQPDTRSLFIGLQGIGYCPADDAVACEAFVRKLRSSPLLRASRAISRVTKALRPDLSSAHKRRALQTTREALRSRPTRAIPTVTDEAFEPASDEVLQHLAPELAGRPVRELYHDHSESIEVRQLGREERTRWGNLPTLRGVESIRGFCISRKPIADLQISINGFSLYRGPLRGGYELTFELDSRVNKYVFNLWYDFSPLPHGLYEMELRFAANDGELRHYRRKVVVGAPRPASLYASSDRLVMLPEHGQGSLDEQVNAAPSSIRPARRSFFETPIRNVLVMRADQLGDLVCSIPALRRLRQVLPQARLVGMLSPTNEALARGLNLFDEIIVVDFPDDPMQRVRVMPIEQQRALERQFATYNFDLAIDMSDSGVSRPVLHLSRARYTFGFRPGEFHWLSSAFEGVTRDPLNGLECVPHTTKVMGLIEWLGALSKSHASVVRRDDLKRESLAEFTIGAQDRYVVLHTGARIKFSRWPHYAALAELLLSRTDWKVVMMADDSDYRNTLPEQLLGSPRFQLIDRRLAFDQFDALLSFCDGFVGNDSGPKHLASLRGANVVSIHLARNNWNEWGQENKGYIVSRRVPCAGCSLHHDPEECGKGFACITNIRAEEVFDALLRAMSGAEPAQNAGSGAAQRPVEK